MDPMLLPVALLAALLAGGVAWVVRTRALSRLRAGSEVELTALRNAAADARAEAAQMRGRLEAAQKTEAELVAAREELRHVSATLEGVRAEARAAATHHAAEIAQLTEMREAVQKEFKLLAGDVLKVSNEDFSRRAQEIFEAQKKLTAEEIDKRTKTIADTVKPLGDRLQAYELMVKEIEKARVENYGGLSEALKIVTAQQDEVKKVTAHLVGALKASPKTRGRWGEETLRRVVELSGMIEHCSFETEFPIPDEGLRPDMVIRVSGGRSVVVDAKAPLSAYFDAINATTDEERERFLILHAKQLRERLTNLSSKSYWSYITGSADCVAMFVPGDNFVSAAFEYDPNLFEDAIKHRVLICTPTTFIALMKAISYGWGQEKLAQSAAEIGALGKELYTRLASLGEHIAKLGRNLETAVKSYNGLIGSLETKVMPQARRFNDLGVEGSAAPLPELAEIDTTARLPLAGRDLLLPPES